VGKGAYEFARAHGHPHVELLTERSRRAWLEWKERMSDVDDRLPPPRAGDKGGEKHGSLLPDDLRSFPRYGTVHCSALARDGALACVTTTSGLSFKIPGRVGDSPLIGCGLYCDQEAGSAGSTGRGEATILAHGSSSIVELMRQGRSPLDAGLELLQRIVRQTERMARWQPALFVDGRPSFDVNYYCLSADGRWAGVTLHQKNKKFAVADPAGGPRLEPLVALFD
jgi:N4-(beta-N-acetylglucosaminyl)-L-asparaginase